MEKYLSFMVPRQSGKKSHFSHTMDEYALTGNANPMMKALQTELSSMGDVPFKFLSTKDKTKALKKKYNLSHGKGKRKKRK